jgi:hypothetical protein
MMDDNLAKVKVAEQKSDWDELDKALETQAGLKKKMERYEFVNTAYLRIQRKKG